MDIFSLPDLCIRKVMSHMEFKDRLSIRLTCRAFERIVAETHAGYFEYGRLHITKDFQEKEDVLSVRFGDQNLYALSALTESGFVWFLHLRNRFFSGISFERLSIKLGDSILTLQFAHKFLEKFKIEMLDFSASSDSELMNSIKLMADFPNSQYSLVIYATIGADMFMLPAVQQLEIYSKIATPTFFNLLAIHKNIYFGYKAVVLTSDEWIKVVQMISDDARKRTVRLGDTCSEISTWLRAHGITQRSAAGDICGEFSVTNALEDNGEIGLRYKNCWIRIYEFAWNADILGSVTINSSHQCM